MLAIPYTTVYCPPMTLLIFDFIIPVEFDNVNPLTHEDLFFTDGFSLLYRIMGAVYQIFVLLYGT